MHQTVIGSDPFRSTEGRFQHFNISARVRFSSCHGRYISLLGGHSSLCLQDDVNYSPWRAEQWRVIDWKRVLGCTHSFRHEVLGFGVDHAIFFGNQEPGRLRPPRRF
jgi:hypothetical protein